MNSRPLVSVIIPCFNSAAFVAEAIESVLAQSYQNLEIILVDDGSSDGTIGVIEEYARNYERVHLIQRGVSSGRPGVARNAGLERASGEFVCFLDADDYWSPSRVETLLRLLLEHEDCVAAFHDIELVDEQGRFIERYLEKFSIEAKKYLSWAGGSVYRCDRQFFIFQSIHYGAIHTISVMIAADRLGRQQLRFDSRYRIGEDTDLWIRLGLAGPIVYLDEVLASYRQHPKSITRDRVRVQEEMLSLMEDNFCRVAAAMTDDEQTALRGRIASYYASLGWMYRVKYVPLKSVRAYIRAWQWSGAKINLLFAAKALFPARGV